MVSFYTYTIFIFKKILIDVKNYYYSIVKCILEFTRIMARVFH